MRFAAAAIVFLAVGLSVHAQQPAFRAEVELVSLTVTAMAPGGTYVSDLTADDFVVCEDGQPQDVVFFGRADSHLAVSLLVDTSASMAPHLTLATQAAREFIAQLGPGDIAQIIDFDSRVRVVQPFTGDRAALEAALDEMTAAGLTSLYNALYVAIHEFRQLQQERHHQGEIRRHVIVVLSDGKDTSSLMTYEALLAEAQRSPSVIFAVGLGLEPRHDAITFARDDPRFVLRRLSQQTGGRLLLATQAQELSTLYASIAEELTTQYVLGYVPPQRDDNEEWRSVSVRVNRPNVQTRTRPGYFAGAAIGTAARIDAADR